MNQEPKEEEGSGFQEERGEVLTNVIWNTRCVVVAEAWPSWSFALQALSAQSILTVIPKTDVDVVKELKATSIGGTLVQCPDEGVAGLLTPGSLLLVQGSRKFVEEQRAAMGLQRELAECPFLGIYPATEAGSDEVDGRQYKVSHKQFGGVTTGVWSLVSSVQLSGLKSKHIKRRLEHVLSSVEGGCPVDEVGNLPGPTSRLPVKERDPDVVATSVFAKGGLVRQKLTEKELMSCYDIEEASQLAILGVAEEGEREGSVRSSRAYLEATPLKVLCGVGRWIRRATGNLVLRTTGATIPENSEQRKVSGIREAEAAVNVVSSQSVGAESGLEDSEPSQVATKRDDAPVDVENWDRWSVDNFFPPESDKGKTPLVCKAGSYSSQAHGRLFNALRALLLRRVRRNALRGLLEYLRIKHGERQCWQQVKYRRRRKRRRRKKKRKRNQEEPEAELLRMNSRHLRSRDEGRLRAFGLSGERSFRVAEWVTKGCRKLRPRRGRNDRSPEIELWRDVAVGRDAISRLAKSSWWSWDDGSTLMFWRWPKRWQRSIRDGTKLFLKPENLPHFFHRQRWPSDPVQGQKMKEKIGKVRSRRYISPGEVNSLTGYFAVPKGEDDIRIVYDATACGLNEALWAPSFFLPTIDSVLRNANKDSWYGDIDLGEMFLNYFLDEEVRRYAGVDVSKLGADRWERWERTLMGLRPSPYVCTQSFGWCEDCIRGDRRDQSNVFHWDTVKLNLPGDQNYNPALPWVYRWDESRKKMPGYFGSYIDDIRTIDASDQGCRAVSRRVAAWVNYLGQQDAARKRRPPSKEPGAWAGAMCLSKADGLYVTCTQKKWERAQEIVRRWHKQVVEEEETKVEAKQMEKDVGFLVHLSRTFPSTFPYLKGFYLTLNSWRKGRNDEGWKYSMAEWKAALDLEDDLPGYRVREEVRRKVKAENHDDRPSLVQAVPRLQTDLLALKKLYSGDSPTLRLVRGDKMSSVKIAFGDASGKGFGSSWESGGRDTDEALDKVAYRFGTWDAATSSESSNYRELRNLVETMQAMADGDELSGVELFIFTDNSTAESAFAKGSSSSRSLFELILQVRDLEMTACCKVHMVHVAGTRMIAQGSDGLSRGNLTEGVMRGSSMKEFIPINKSALDRSPGLQAWLESWIQGGSFLTPEQWFTLGHEIREEEVEHNSEGMSLPVTRPGTFIWSPPPAAARAALEELRKSRHKSFESTHVVVIPRLFSTEWRKELYKAADIVLTLPVGHPAWPHEMHEPLTIALLFPFLNHRPWELRRAPELLDLGSSLHEVWKSDAESEGPLLRELWSLPRRLASLSTRLARELLYGKRKRDVSRCSPRKR